LFDTGDPLAAEDLISEIETNGFSFAELEQIIISHGHADHAGGASAILDRRRVRVLAHAADIPAIQGRPHGTRRPAAWLRRFLMHLRRPYRPVESVSPVDQGETLRALPLWQVLRTPGHTFGSISLLQPAAKILLCGDALSNRGGRLTIPTGPRCHDPLLARESVRKLSHLDLEILGCGHGPVIRTCAGLRIQESLPPLS
jgi:glyoxylase-like metal-dependent hydrolase (beta-lactamase superfamily II)